MAASSADRPYAPAADSLNEEVCPALSGRPSCDGETVLELNACALQNRSVELPADVPPAQAPADEDASGGHSDDEEGCSDRESCCSGSGDGLGSGGRYRLMEGVLEGEHDYNVHVFQDSVNVFRGAWDEEGVYFYQAYNDEIAAWAVKHQQFGGPKFNPTRMTWIKPSFAWVLYRSGYASKHNQTRILKVKLPHIAVAGLLSKCQCKHGGGGSKGRVQWDPARDLMAADDRGREPRKQLRGRAIQIGIKGSLSEHYVRCAISIQDVTELAHRVAAAHRSANPKVAMAELLPELPGERPYMPRCVDSVIARLRMLQPGDSTSKPTREKQGKHRRR
uniref:Uncharacterized protein n=1 Tax=Alexandrium monilatum TaxID=311494 RepID=A0A7S4SMQ9_9DINO|mmetsp:Transcript_49648/g.156259  ORF Transcript_49648/g.156259 Transcript_49648/m.156259 type:complete len:334 (+) Transcript_49648:77-1078(+)